MLTLVMMYVINILTAAARLAHLAELLSEADQSSPQQINDNDRRRQRRFLFILDRETVAVKAPRLCALFFHFLVRVTTLTDKSEKNCYPPPDTSERAPP